MNFRSGTTSATPPISCAQPYGTAHRFHIAISETTAFRCCETCGLTHRLRNAHLGVGDTWEEIDEPAEKVEEDQ